MSTNDAVFPPGYATALYVQALFAVALRSRLVRAFFYELPRSQLRTWFVARYYAGLVEQFRNGDYRFLASTTRDVQLTLFDIGTYVGRNGVRQALSDWRETFESPVFETVQFANPPGPIVLLTVRVGGRSVAGGVELEDSVYFVIHVQRGMATRLGIYRDRAAALEAVQQQG
jgi:hypothetical protein